MVEEKKEEAKVEEETKEEETKKETEGIPGVGQTEEALRAVQGITGKIGGLIGGIFGGSSKEKK